jgi:hypothetical protein
MTKFAQVGDFCPDETCPDYGKRQSDQQHNITKYGKTKAGRQRYKWQTCGATFTETKGTIFYRRRTPEDEIIDTLALIAEGNRISSLVRAKGHTVSDGWGGIDDAMVEVYGKVPAYKGRGRRPTRKRPQPGWQYVQMVKQREQMRIVGIKVQVVFGDPMETLALLGQSTSYIERTHRSAEITRKPDHASLQWSSDWQDLGFQQGCTDVPSLCSLGGSGPESGPLAQDVAYLRSSATPNAGGSNVRLQWHWD